MIKNLAVDKIKKNPNNPRIIKDTKFRKLVQSIQDFPEMLQLRPLILNQDLVILGGNQRLKALKEAGVKEVPVRIVNWSPDQQKEFTIKDNLNYGNWDWKNLKEAWNLDQLDEWGMELPPWIYSNDIKDLNLESLADLPGQGSTSSTAFRLKFTIPEFDLILQGLTSVDENLNIAVLKILNLYDSESID